MLTHSFTHHCIHLSRTRCKVQSLVMLKSFLVENCNKKANLAKGKPASTDLHFVIQKEKKTLPKAMVSSISACNCRVQTDF